MANYQPVIGMEIHLELKTQSKMFCGCPADHFGQSPNTQTCPVCLGLPGALPVPNHQAIIFTQTIGAAFGCQLATTSKFDRKHYFYPDLPKGYQISQYDEPLCLGGTVDTKAGIIHLTRIHLEEDTGKLQHATLSGQKVSLVDFNRSGVPLVEIVSEPEIHSSQQAKEYAQTVQQLIRYLDVSDADMEKGSMRLEANISLSENQQLPPYKVEVKNLNSFRFVEKAISYELDRQHQLLNHGKLPVQETRGFDESRGVTYSQRSKEEAKDYRYFPEPDIPPLTFSISELNKIKSLLPLLPKQYLHYYQQFNIRPDYANQLVETPQLAKTALTAFKLLPKKAPQIASLLINKKSSRSLSPQALVAKLNSPSSPTLSPANLKPFVDQVISKNPDIITKYQAGKKSVIGVLIGQVIKASGGQADPQIVKQLITQQLQSN